MSTPHRHHVVGTSIPAMHTILARRPDLAACFPLAASFADWAWSA